MNNSGYFWLLTAGLIEGIQIDPNHFLRSHFADDTTLFVKDIGFVNRLVATI